MLKLSIIDTNLLIRKELVAGDTIGKGTAQRTCKESQMAYRQRT